GGVHLRVDQVVLQDLLQLVGGGVVGRHQLGEHVGRQRVEGRVGRREHGELVGRALQDRGEAGLVHRLQQDGELPRRLQGVVDGGAAGDLRDARQTRRGRRGGRRSWRAGGGWGRALGQGGRGTGDQGRRDSGGDKAVQLH